MTRVSIKKKFHSSIITYHARVSQENRKTHVDKRHKVSSSRMCRIDYCRTFDTLDCNSHLYSLVGIIECTAMHGQVARHYRRGSGGGGRLPSVCRERRRAYASYGHCYRRTDRSESAEPIKKCSAAERSVRASHRPPSDNARGEPPNANVYTSSDVHSPRCQRPPLLHSTHGEVG